MQILTLHNPHLQSCTYILYKEDNTDVYLIDCGAGEPIINFIREHKKELKGVFLTHCHSDHILGLNDLLSTFNHFKVYASKQTIEGLSNTRTNLSKYHVMEFTVENQERIIEIQQKSEIYLFSTPLTILETPGHDAGCLSFLIGQNLFTGDSYIPWIPVFTKWKRSNKQEALKSESYLKMLVDFNKYKLYPGHYI